MENFDKLHILRLVEELRPSPLHHFRFELIPEVSQNKLQEEAQQVSPRYRSTQKLKTSLLTSLSGMSSPPSSGTPTAARMDALAKAAVAKVRKQVETRVWYYV